LQFANATIGWYEITKADNAVAALKATLKPIATAKRDGTWKQIDGAILVPGDCVLLGSGSAVPADCKVLVSGLATLRHAMRDWFFFTRK
jgi:H+-transporting ATPase